MHHFNGSILREYDIRGIVGSTLRRVFAELSKQRELSGITPPIIS